MSLVEPLPSNRSPFVDQVTGLSSAAMFRELLGHSLLRSRRSPMDLAVLRLHLDGIPELAGDPDVAGDPELAGTPDVAGDPSRQLLQLAAARIVSCLRAGDVAARLAGPEFAVLLENTWSPSDASVVAQRILAAFRSPLVVGDAELALTASVGVAVGTAPDRARDPAGGATAEPGLAADPATSADAFIRRAELAMEAARSAGGDGFRLSATAPPDASIQLLIRTTDLREGLERDEIEVAYQPVVEIDTGRVTGFEVLVRWNHPTLGLLAPRDFVPVAESSGLMERLGERVLRQSLQQLAGWQRDHPIQSELSVSVNIASSQLHRDSFPAEIRQLMSDSGVSPGTLILEVDEAALRVAGQGTLDDLNQLRRAGVRIYLDNWRVRPPAIPPLDDLSELPLDGLKLAAEVVAALPDEAAMDTARSALALAFTADLDPVVAKGVETAEQWRILAELGFRLGQGYRIGTPQDATETGALLAD
ncbi:MAG: hypothetical protein QG671_911 [Actinomycetota bacterium]|nr:hypothetical protein [Actinomycetota bacterium]